MSFAQETKASLAALSDAMKHDCCRRAALYGIMYAMKELKIFAWVVR